MGGVSWTFTCCVVAVEVVRQLLHNFSLKVDIGGSLGTLCGRAVAVQ